MLKLKLFVIIAVIAAASCLNQIPENYRNAKPISAHPRYQDHQMQKNFPKNVNNNLEISPFIVGGQPADLGQFPHHALMFIVYPGDQMYLCGGSVIDRNWILTAAHCVYGGAEYFEIYLGVVSFSGYAAYYTRVFPKDVVIHFGYNENTLENDIAMMKLVNATEDLFFDPNVAPINLPHEYVDLVDQTGTIIGLGRELDNSTSVSGILKFNTLKAISFEECASYYYPGLVHQANLCAETNSEASTCGGDSGGSYIFNIDGSKRLEGVTSFGAERGCQLGYPVGFTRVASYIDWILFNMSGGTTTTPPPETNRWVILRKILEKIREILKNIFGRP